MKHILRGLTAIALLLALTGCTEEPPIAGTVLSRTHVASELKYEYGTDCGMSLEGKYSCGEPMYRWVTHPEKWVLTIEDATGDQHQVAVSETKYRAHPVGTTYDSLAG